jgi:ABC-2 type transport system ATP-binding protein
VTVEEYLRYCAFLRRVPGERVNKAVDEAVEKCGITHFRKRLIRNLSGGYQQRVGIAQAIIHEPALVVLDEPTNGLDPNQILEIRHLIKEIAEERTVILSTHILSEVQATCDYIRMVEQGHLVFAGTVEEFDNYIAPNSLLVALAEAPPATDLTAIEGVVGVEELGGNRFRLKFTDAREVVDRIVKASVENDWHLIEIGVEKNSLDAIFAELSKKETRGGRN